MSYRTVDNTSGDIAFVQGTSYQIQQWSTSITTAPSVYPIYMPPEMLGQTTATRKRKQASGPVPDNNPVVERKRKLRGIRL